MKIIYYMFQPMLCYLHFHDWYRVKGGERKCSYCNRHEVMTHVDSQHGPQWSKK